MNILLNEKQTVHKQGYFQTQNCFETQTRDVTGWLIE